MSLAPSFDADRKYGAIMSAHLSHRFSVGFISLKVNESISPEVKQFHQCFNNTTNQIILIVFYGTFAS